MRRADLISGIFWLAIGILLSVWSATYQIGGILDPGPGFYPLGLGLLLIVFSIVLLIGQARKPLASAGSAPPLITPGSWRKIGFTVVVLVLATFLFEVMGYLLTIFLFMVFLMVAGEMHNWKKALLIAVLTTAGIYVVFVRLLEQPLPYGLLGI